jgi:3-oxoacyl-[acyl-carrier protein] reductase
MNSSRTAIITGASRGIGASIAQRLASDGFAVIVNYASSAEHAGNVVREIVNKGGKAHAIKADVSNAESAALLFEETISVFGGVDVLINNAGVMQPGLVPLADTDDALFEKLVTTNLRGTFNTLRLAATRLRSGGRIVNFSSSVCGLLPPGYSIYTATKAAVEAMTAIFAKELRGKNITVNAIAPGPTATDLFLDHKTEEMIQQMAKMAPLERLGQPKDIADVVSFLCGPDGGWLNGQTLRANGGII